MTRHHHQPLRTAGGETRAEPRATGRADLRPPPPTEDGGSSQPLPIAAAPYGGGRGAPGTSPDAPCQFLQGGAAVARLAHNQEVAGASPAPATKIGRRVSGPRSTGGGVLRGLHQPAGRTSFVEPASSLPGRTTGTQGTTQAMRPSGRQGRSRLTRWPPGHRKPPNRLKPVYLFMALPLRFLPTGRANAAVFSNSCPSRRAEG